MDSSFGHWLSGFTDGEGCFNLVFSKPRNANTGVVYPTPRASFQIAVRQDDQLILEEVRRYLQCGEIYNRGKPKTIKNANPSVLYAVGAISDLTTKVIPHFDLHPLRAKKKNDYLVWKRGVELITHTMTIPRRSRGRGKGLCGRWSEEGLSTFAGLIKTLQDQRKYNARLALPIPHLQTQQNRRTLFD